MEIFDRLIVVSLSLLLLSQIVEKIAGFWKLNGPENLRGKNDDTVEEKVREKKISNATFIVGIFIALFLKVDIVEIFKNNNTGETLGWEYIITASHNNNNVLALYEDVSNISDADSSKYSDEQLSFRMLHRESKLYYYNLRYTPGLLGVVSIAVIFAMALMAFYSIYNWMQLYQAFAHFLKKYENSILDLLLKCWYFWIFILFSTVAFLLHLFTPDAIDTQAYLSLSIGIVLSGAAVSFGSKFWHDLLDMLFAINAKTKQLTKLNELQYNQKTGEFEENSTLPVNITVGVDRSQASFSDIADYIRNNKVFDNWSKSHGAIGVFPGFRKRTGIYNSDIVLSVHVKDKLDSNSLGTISPIPREILWTAPRTGEIMTLRTDVVQTKGVIHTSGSLSRCYDDIGLRPGIGIYSDEYPNLVGTLGCFARAGNNSRYLISCAHVLGFTGKNLVRAKGNNGQDLLLGEVVESHYTSEFDIAIAKITDGAVKRKITYNPIGYRTPKQPIQISESKFKNQHSIFVHISGFTSGNDTGYVTSYYGGELSINTNDGGTHKMKNLLVCTRMADEGDSGSLVIDCNDNAIGLCIAVSGDHETTYIMPLHNALKRLHVELATGDSHE